jgi:hypothetical protein
MQQLYQSPASRSILFSTLTIIVQDVSMIEDPYPVEFKDGKLYPSDYGSNKSFGSHIDIWEDYAVIGCKKENGAYVFKNVSNNWTEMKKLELRANYGIGDVCFNNGWIMVGTEYANGTGKVEAYHLIGVGDEIVLVQELHSNLIDDRFGASIDMSDEYLIVGAQTPWNDCMDCGINKKPGGAYIFKLSGEQWILNAEFDANPASEYDGYGREVAISDNFAFVMGRNDSVYVYSNLSGTWSLHSFLRPEPILVQEKEFVQSYGQTIEVDGNLLLIGAPLYPVSGLQDRLGAVYIYELQNDQWVYKDLLINPNTVPNEEVNEFGSTLGVEGDYMIVGGQTSYIGGGVVFKYNGSDWVYTHYIEPPDDLVSHGFGVAMDISENWMLVGHSGDMDTGNEAGAVYVFENEY